MITMNVVSRRVLAALVDGPKALHELFVLTGIDPRGLYKKVDGEWTRGTSGTWGTRVVDQEVQRLRRADHIRYVDRKWHLVEANTK